MWFTEAYALRLLKPMRKLDVQVRNAISMANCIASWSMTFYFETLMINNKKIKHLLKKVYVYTWFRQECILGKISECPNSIGKLFMIK